MDSFFQLINKSIDISSENLIGFKDKEEFERALGHLKDIILSSIKLLENDFYSQSIFLGITALEEIAKIEICIFRGSQVREIHKRAKDPLFNHKSKQTISANPIVLIGDRLKKSIGEERLISIFKDLHAGKYVEVRESCLYFQRDKNELIIPSERINKTLAYEILLIVIEMVDDKFWGVTRIASAISDELNKYYKTIEDNMKK